MAEAPAHADPEDLTGLDESFERSLTRRAGERGYLGVDLPTAVGGGGRPAEFRAAFEMEVGFHDAPLVDTAVTLAGAPLLRFGSPAQQEVLAAMVAGEASACIAYSEAEAGSDLSAVRAEAVPAVGGGLELRGTKVLVTGAHKADWCLTIARTRPEGPVRQALSMLLVEMVTPGVSVRRHPTMNGWTLCEVVFDGVPLAPGAVVGERDAGWPQLLATVSEEAAPLYHVGFAERLLAALATTLEAQGRAGDPVVRDRIGRLRARLDASARLGLRAVRAASRGEGPAVPAAMSKVYATELLQSMAIEAAELVGPEATRWAPLFDPAAGAAASGARLGYELLERVHGTIGGGTNETKRTLLALQGLGLPRPERH